MAQIVIDLGETNGLFSFVTIKQVRGSRQDDEPTENVHTALEPECRPHEVSTVQMVGEFAAAFVESDEAHDTRTTQGGPDPGAPLLSH
jgi:hypothetical protein